MGIVKNIFIVVYVLVCLALIIISMIQNKEDAGMSGTISGSSTSNFYEKNKGRTKEGKLKKWTIIIAIVFLVLTIALSIIYAL